MSTMTRVLAWVLLVALTGCGRNSTRDIVTFEGKIAFTDGTNLPAGTLVVFSPAEGVIRSATGTVAGDASFRVQHASGTDGAEIGKYIVQLRAPSGKEQEFYRQIPPAFCDPGMLTAEISNSTEALSFQIPKAWPEQAATHRR